MTARVAETDGSPDGRLSASGRHRHFLFTDIEGSTKLLNELGPQRYAD